MTVRVRSRTRLTYTDTVRIYMILKESNSTCASGILVPPVISLGSKDVSSSDLSGYSPVSIETTGILFQPAVTTDRVKVESDARQKGRRLSCAGRLRGSFVQRRDYARRSICSEGHHRRRSER